MNISQWIKYGVDNGFCTPSYCDTHDGMPMTTEEENMWEVGEDPCAHAVRLIESPEMAKNLAENNKF